MSEPVTWSVPIETVMRDALKRVADAMGKPASALRPLDFQIGQDGDGAWRAFVRLQPSLEAEDFEPGERR